MKKCKKCEQDRELSCFYKSEDAYCKGCKKAYNREYYIKHRAKLLEYKKEYISTPDFRARAIKMQELGLTQTGAPIKRKRIIKKFGG